MKISASFTLFLVLAFTWPPPILGAGGSVIGIVEDVDELELYESAVADDPVETITTDQVKFPVPIVETSKNGMLKIVVKDSEFWVISDDVETDITREIDSNCDPKMAGTVVAHGKRGAAEGCR